MIDGLERSVTDGVAKLRRALAEAKRPNTERAAINPDAAASEDRELDTLDVLPLRILLAEDNVVNQKVAKRRGPSDSSAWPAAPICPSWP